MKRLSAQETIKYMKNWPKIWHDSWKQSFSFETKCVQRKLVCNHSEKENLQTVCNICYLEVNLRFSNFNSVFNISSNHRDSQHSLLEGSVGTFDLFAAKVKRAGFNTIKCVLWLKCKAKIIVSLSKYLRLT